ncbi:sodium/proline symporter PutP [Nocardioides albus]|uniref:Sodium/proline symporter n=1 Tax=Nocardioides albus TaxID=1841 RepID=A0A7W5F8L7_9ACTN|nr:sodium/proline symporter PutP [Nocardioides albus]MBB3089201.1 sodium/proline symporter [Nocardioides albus]GGU13586.1 sodium:proline symporter [Nocardioides albus]
MSDLSYQMLTLVAYMVAMLGIGAWAYRRTSNLDDYMLGGRDLGPMVSALSAGASDMSGWLLMGLPGAIYATGLMEGWIAVGLTVGAWLNWKIVAPRLRTYTEVSGDSITVPSFLENRLKDSSRLLRMASGAVILVFFTFYVSSGIVAGGVFFESSFNTDFHTGMLVVTAVVVAYTLFGGFLAVSYTDFVQGTIMLLALILVPVVGVFATGGPAETLDSIRAVDPSRLSMVEGATFLGVVSALAWGLGYFGQPHIIVRFMALRSAGEAASARRIGIGWMLLSLFGAVGTALVGIAYYQQNPDATLTDPEAVFIALGQILFHPLIAGIMLAAVLAAIMSTISSQLLVTSSALVEDLYKAVFKNDASDRQLVMFGRLAVLGIAVVAAVLAWPQRGTVLDLVGYAWAGFGGSFGPIILLALWWRKLTAAGALAGLVVGAVTVVVWGNIDALSSQMYEIVPGFVLNMIVAVGVSLLTYRENPAIEAEFDEAIRLLDADGPREKPAQV